MKQRNIIDYLENNCICDPNNKINDPHISTCGFVCDALWHWSQEIQRLRIGMKLSKKVQAELH